MDTQEILISRACEADVGRIGELLLQVNHVHALVRPDLFADRTRKYADDEIREIISDEARPVFVAKQGKTVVGYVFCVFQMHDGRNEPPHATLYVDDLCVDENARGHGIGSKLWEHVCRFARERGIYNITLNVWEGNADAIAFYRKIGLHIQKYGMEFLL